MDIVLQNKLTLVDFWGSWCTPCREEIPNLKKVYEAFKDKGFSIISVAFEINRNAWLNALKQEKMPWIQVSQVKNRGEEASILYDVNGVPASILIDGNGKIVAINLPGSRIASSGGIIKGEELYKKVEEVLGKNR
jgi:thiol-disulfide isomerase/thioredoxin